MLVALCVLHSDTKTLDLCLDASIFDIYRLAFSLYTYKYYYRNSRYIQYIRII